MTGLSHKDDLLETPPWLVELIQKETRLLFNLDVCANKSNAICNEFIDTQLNALNQEWIVYDIAALNTKSKKLLLGGMGTRGLPTVFCNPPRTINGKFVTKASEQWKKHNMNIVMLLCWNDFGNKYGEKLFPHILSRRIKVRNLGKIKFYKNGKETKFPSRLTYLYAWFKSKH